MYKHNGPPGPYTEYCDSTTEKRAKERKINIIAIFTLVGCLHTGTCLVELNFESIIRMSHSKT